MQNTLAQVSCVSKVSYRCIHGNAPDVVGFTARISVQQTIINGHSCGSFRQVRTRQLKGAHVGTVLCYLIGGFFCFISKVPKPEHVPIPDSHQLPAPALIFFCLFSLIPFFFYPFCVLNPCKRLRPCPHVRGQFY